MHFHACCVYVEVNLAVIIGQQLPKPRQVKTSLRHQMDRILALSLRVRRIP